MSRDQQIRGLLFYVGAFTFLLGLPFILSYALGYAFDPNTLRFTKTGLLVLKTQPPGVDIYFNNRLLNEKTPTTINELLPGRYSLSLELKNHYAWKSFVQIHSGRVTRLEDIILFPLRPNIQNLSKERFSVFYLDEEKGFIYYVDPEANSFYRSDLDGEDFEFMATLAKLTPPATQYKLSPDRKKILYFNQRQIGISYIQPAEQGLNINPAFTFNFPRQRIQDCFWHSNSYYLVLITNKTVEALEARPGFNSVVLVNLNKQNSKGFYDADSDTLYFLDSQKAQDNKIYDNVYKLELNQKIRDINNLEDLIKRTINEKN
jgi:hypothetical protein